MKTKANFATLILDGDRENDENDENDGCELAVCIGCSNDIPAADAHNAVAMGTLCENCCQMAG